MKDRKLFFKKKIKMNKKKIPNKSLRRAIKWDIQFSLVHLSNILVIPGNMWRSYADH